jgi:hypothetical protein
LPTLSDSEGERARENVLAFILLAGLDYTILPCAMAYQTTQKKGTFSDGR